MPLITMLIEWVATAIELLAVGVIVLAIIMATITLLRQMMARDVATSAGADADRYKRFRTTLGRGLLIGLEILVAADIIRTVALEPTLDRVLALGVLVLIRVVLSWSLTVEIEGRWPWQPVQS